MPVNRRPGSPNSFFSDEDDFGLSDIGRLIKGAEREPAILRQMRMRLENAQAGISAINSLESYAPGSINKPVFAKQLLSHQRTEAALGPRIGLYEATREERTSAQAVNSIGRGLSESSISSYVSRSLNGIGNQSMGLGAPTNTSYTELQKRQQDIRGEMGRVRQRAMNSAENLYDEEGGIDQGAVRKLHTSQARFKGLANELTTVTAGLSQFKHEGRDPQSRMLALTKAAQNASGVLNTNSIEEQMKNRTGLGALSPQDLKQKETDASLKLIKAMDELRHSFGKSDEVIEKLADKAEGAAKELENVQEAQGMGGNNGNRYESAKIIAGTVMEALSVITAGYQNVAINQPMQMMSNVQGAANLENEKYNMWHAAIGGDMTARMTLGAWKTSGDFGEQLASAQNKVHIAKGVTNGIGVALGGAQIVEAGVGAAGEVVGLSRIEAGAQGAKTAISAGVGGIEEGIAWGRNTETARLRIDGTHAGVNAAKALNYIPGHQLQAYRDYTMGLNEAASEMGGSTGEAFLNQTAGTGFLSKMRSQGVGFKEMGALSAQGANQMGSMFNANQVIESTRLENLGHGSATENMRRMGILGAAGGQNPSQNLSKIIEEGMQRGLNSSKAIDMIVENTARMTEETAKVGGTADPTEFLTRTILGAIDKNNPNKEMAGQIAYQAYQTAEGARNNIATSFPGMINVARIQTALGLGTDQKSAALIAQMSSGTLNAYRDKPEELKNFLESQGVSRKTLGGMDPSLFKNNKFLETVNVAKAGSELAQQSGIGYAAALPSEFLAEALKYKGNKGVINALRSGRNLDTLPEELRTMRANVAFGYGIQGRNPNAGISSALALAGIITDKDNDDTLAKQQVNSKHTARGLAQEEKRRPNMADADQATAGGRGLGADAGGAAGIKGLAKTGEDAFKRAGKNAEEAWKGAAEKTATNFGASAMKLDHAATDLGKSAVKLLEGTAAMATLSKGFAAMMDKIVKTLPEGPRHGSHITPIIRRVH